MNLHHFDIPLVTLLAFLLSACGSGDAEVVSHDKTTAIQLIDSLAIHETDDRFIGELVDVRYREPRHRGDVVAHTPDDGDRDNQTIVTVPSVMQHNFTRGGITENMGRFTRRTLLGSLPLTVWLAGCLGGGGDEGDGTDETDDGGTTDGSSTSNEGDGTTTDGGAGTDRRSTTEATTTATGENTIIVGPDGDHTFEPESLTITAGETVTFRWDSDQQSVICALRQPGR